MADINIVGIGVWCEFFSNWDEFCSALAGSATSQATTLRPELIPAKERRRAPLSVKMAIEVMDQACRMSALVPSEVATVFASVNGDVEVTDYLCRTLDTAPRTVSPTRFHNSVHNAPIGNWAIATHCKLPASAMSAYLHTTSMAFLEGAIQSLEENMPVLVCVQELAAPDAIKPICDTEQSISTAVLLAPPGYCGEELATVRFEVRNERSVYPDAPQILGIDWSGNLGARFLPLLVSLTTPGSTELQLPISESASLSLAIAVK